MGVQSGDPDFLVDENLFGPRGNQPRLWRRPVSSSRVCMRRVLEERAGCAPAASDLGTVPARISAARRTWSKPLFPQHVSNPL